MSPAPTVRERRGLRWRRSSALPIALFVVAGCGARTDIDVPSFERDASTLRFDGGARDASIARDAGEPSIDAGASDAGRDAGVECPALRVSFGSVRPTVILILDRSGSMRALFRSWTPRYSSASRWEVIRGILVGDDERDGLLDLNAPRIRYGLITYTSTWEACPDLRIVPPRLDNAGPIFDELFGSGPEGGTPTAESIRAATAMLPAFVEGDEPVAFVLATDGEPNGCGPGGDSRAEVIAATSEAFDLGVRTFVLSVGRDVAEDHLQDVANAGAGRGPSDGDAEFWVGTAPASLQEALEAALASATSCVGTLSTPLVDPARACELGVTFGGEPVACDDPDGFTIDGAGRIRFSGEACARVRTGEAELEIDAACDLLEP